ncbi:unnamed protein product [Dicrocoelium dendriticum]|nr:unnamed protein product [Dicrocoelium dendriticum]
MNEVACRRSANNAKTYIGPREYIYNLVPQTRTDEGTRYKCLPKIRIDKAKLGVPPKKYPMKTFGPPPHDQPLPVVYPNKRTYMKKHCKKPYVKLMNHSIADCRRIAEKRIRQNEDGSAGSKTESLADPKPILPNIKQTKPIDGANEVPIRCLKRERNAVNWITRNAISAITSKPGFRVPPGDTRRIVDTRKGDRQQLKSNRTVSGLEPLYVYKPGFGEVPACIVKWKNALRETRDLLSKYVNEKEIQGTDYLLTPEQRENLLNGLKAAWDKYNRKFLGLASINDTLKGKAYREYLQNQLDSLKADIDLVEGHQFLFVEAPKDPTGEPKEVIKHICA